VLFAERPDEGYFRVSAPRRIKVNEKVITTDVAKIKLNNGDLVTIAFAPKGADLPPPPTAADLARLDPTTDEVLPEGETTTPPATDDNTTTVPGDTSTTAPAAGGETTTTAAP
jgi:hypothetical protein